MSRMNWIDILLIVIYQVLLGGLVKSTDIASSLSSNSPVNLARSSSWERIIVDPKIIHSDQGVPVNFSYNETNNESEDSIPSVAGCPKSVEGYPWIYYGNEPTCYLVGTRGPCPAGQLLFGNRNKFPDFGICKCMCRAPRIRLSLLNGHSTLGINEDGGPIVKENEQFRFCHFKEFQGLKEEVLDKQNGACYFLETQGICKEGEWTVKDETGQGLTCIPACSPASGPLSTFLFDYKSRQCVKKASRSIQPVSLSSSIGQRACDDGQVFSKLLQKCVSKLKAYMMKMR